MKRILYCVGGALVALIIFPVMSIAVLAALYGALWLLFRIPAEVIAFSMIGIGLIWVGAAWGLDMYDIRHKENE